MSSLHSHSRSGLGALCALGCAAVTLAVWGSGTAAQAQTISTSAGEFTFSGLFTTDGPDNVPQTADDFLGAPLATVNVSGVGYLTGGAIFGPGPVPGFPLSPTFRAGVANDERGANYTFVFDAGPGVIVDPFTGVGDPSVVTEYTTGTISIFRVPDAPGVTTNNTFGTGTPANRATFADGTLFLSMSIPFLRSTFDPRFGQGSVSGSVVFTGGELFTSFLVPFGIPLAGTVNAQTNLFNPNTPANPGGPYDFQADGRIDIIPESGTLALAGVALLPLAGAAFRKRLRRGA